MKANELMIGDWVLTLDSIHKEKVFAQVDAIEEGQHSILVTRECSNWFVDIDWIEPIPLTPEILEKNGFEDWDGWSIYSPENTGIEIAWLGTILKIGGECGNLELPAIEYVHQLQHALRLCGIEKTIEL